MDRRLFLSATLAASVVISAPAIAAPQVTDFDAAVATFYRCWDAMLNDPHVDVLPSHPDYQVRFDHSCALGDATNQAFRRVMEMPAPDARGLAAKLEVMVQFYTDFEIPEDDLRLVARDARQIVEVAR